MRWSIWPGIGDLMGCWPDWLDLGPKAVKGNRSSNGNVSMSSSRSNQTTKMRKSGDRFVLRVLVAFSAVFAETDPLADAQLIVRFDLMASAGSPPSVPSERGDFPSMLPLGAFAMALTELEANDFDFPWTSFCCSKTLALHAAEKANED